MENAMANARLLSKSLETTGWYTCVSDIHRKKGEFNFKGIQETVFDKENETSADYNAGLPVVAFRFSDQFKKDYREYSPMPDVPHVLLISVTPVSQLQVLSTDKT